MLPTAERISWDRVDAYLERMGSGAIYKRLGLLVETLGEKVCVPAREERLQAWRKRLTGGHAPLEPGGPQNGPVNSRWRVRLNVEGAVVRRKQE
jgi:predicted transcriptional regulator of viral defense system